MDCRRLAVLVLFALITLSAPSSAQEPASIAVSPLSDAPSVAAGASANIEVRIQNLGGSPASVEVRVSEPYVVLDPWVPQRFIDLPAESDAIVNVAVRPAEDAPRGKFQLTVDVGEMFSTTTLASTTFEVTVTDAVVFRPIPPPSSSGSGGNLTLAFEGEASAAAPGTQTTWQVVITNDIAVPTLATFRGREDSGSFTFSFTGGVAQSLGPSESRIVEVIIDVPSDASGFHLISIEAKSSASPDGIATASRFLDARPTWQPPPHQPPPSPPTTAPTPMPMITPPMRGGVDVRMLTTRATWSPATGAVYRANLHNVNDAPLTVEVTARASGAGAAPDITKETTTFVLAPFESREVDVLVRVRSEPPVGSHAVTLDFLAGSEHVLPTVTLEVPVPLVEIITASIILELTPGDEARGQIEIRNPSDARTLRLRPEAGRIVPGRGLEGFTLVWNEGTTELAPGMTAVLAFTLHAPSDARPGAGSAFPYVLMTPGSGLVLREGTILFRVISPQPDGGAFHAMASTVREHPVSSLGVAFAGLGLAAVPFWRREWWRYLLTVPFAALYTRLAKSDVLGHKVREQIYDMIRTRPGIHYSAIKAATGLNAGALVHHLRTLERHGLVVSRREGVLRCFYPSGARLAPPAPRLTQMQSRILELLEREPMSQRALGQRLGLTQQGVSYHVKTLERKGHLVVERENGEWRCHRVVDLQDTASA